MRVIRPLVGVAAAAAIVLAPTGSPPVEEALPQPVCSELLSTWLCSPRLSYCLPDNGVALMAQVQSCLAGGEPGAASLA